MVKTSSRIRKASQFGAIAALTTVAAISLAPVATTFAATLPPGIHRDYSIRPQAPVYDTRAQKVSAVLRVATSKLGTPYIWGHNEDRGQYGFDCSNFTEYVYHHALGYLMSTSSRIQYTSVGYWVSKYRIKPGDLITFDSGGHVGIYAGNGEMIQEGGGLGRVGYLSVAPGSYWYNHISAVKRIF